jgi:hypothetical protein
MEQRAESCAYNIQDFGSGRDLLRHPMESEDDRVCLLRVRFLVFFPNPATDLRFESMTWDPTAAISDPLFHREGEKSN